MPARSKHATVAVVAVIVVLVAAWAIYTINRVTPPSHFCTKTGTGSTSTAAISAYLTRCGGDYSIEKGPYDADKATSAFAAYARVVEYTLRVANNDEGGLAFLMVGKRHAGDKWRTLGPPGTGP